MSISGFLKVGVGAFAIGIASGIIFGSGWLGATVAMVGGGAWGFYCSIEEQKKAAARASQLAMNQILKARYPKPTIIIDGGVLQSSPA